MRKNYPEKVARTATISTLCVIVVWELGAVIAQVKPFWVDEWRIIYNLKFKTFATIWGPLDYMQQFPRAYLEIIKLFASLFDYSYFALRLPSYISATLVIPLAYHLMNKIYSKGDFKRFLFVMILVSSYTFTFFYVQVKQYTMDILLSLVAIWQLLALLELSDVKKLFIRKYVLLCASFLVVPFFSYTYPICVAPVFTIIAIQSMHTMSAVNICDKRKSLLIQWLPLLLCVLSVVAFYIIDVAQLMADKDMHKYWGFRMQYDRNEWNNFFSNFYGLFACVGAGVVFSLLFGVLGVVSFFYGAYIFARLFLKNINTLNNPIRLYSVLLLSLVVVLSLAGKLPMGEVRLNAFTVPSIAILIIYFLDEMKKYRWNRISMVIAVVLYIGVIGNIYTTFFAEITGPVYTRKMAIYISTENAILLAQSRKIPILITPGVAFPYDTTLNLPFKNTVPGDWVLKTFPAYNVGNKIPVYAIKDMACLNEFMKGLPPEMTAVLAGDGRQFHIVNRQ